jgi:thiol-disulfide isomerase/thioredoxin
MCFNNVYEKTDHIPVLSAFAQADTTAPYLRTRALPGFSLLTIDSVEFTQNILDTGKNTIIILFNPECEHCQEQLELFLSIPGLLASTQIVLSSIETHEKNRVFYNKFQLQKYPSVYLGKDHKYFFGGYFRPKTIPVLAFYDKQKQFILLNQGNMKKKQVEKALKL